MNKELLVAAGVTVAAVYVGMILFELTDHYVLKPHVKGQGSETAALPAAK